MKKWAPWFVGDPTVIVTLIVSLCAGLMLAAQIIPTTAAASSSSVTFAASDDTSVAQNATTTNYGTSPQLINDNTSGKVHRTFLKFNVSGVPTNATITSATLQLTATAQSSATSNVKIVPSNSWSESTLTWANAPAYNATILANGTPAPIVAGPVKFNVSSYVKGNGMWSMVITQSQAVQTTWSSKEGTAPPQLTLAYTLPVSTPPTIQMTTPTASTTLSGNQTLAATASSTSGIASVQFYVDGTALGSPVMSAPYTAPWDTTTVPDGLHSLTAVAIDANGLKTTSAAVAVSVKNTVPPPASLSIQLTSPAANQTLSGTQQVLSATATAGTNPIASVQFAVDGSPVGTPLTTTPYTTTWDTTSVADGAHTLSAIVTDTANTTANSSNIPVTVKNTVTNFAPDPVIAAAGDIACEASLLETSTTCRQMETAKLLAGVDAVLPLGDTQYNLGSYADFVASYNPSWGQYRAISHPVPGNHEGTGLGYYQYFGAAAGTPGQGWYSYDLGSWHILAINSNQCALSGCPVGSAQEQWVQADLAAHPTQCTLAYWHQPRWASGSTMGDNAYMGPIYTDLYNAKADLVLAGHNHAYERFQPMDPNGVRDDSNGIQEIIVGTGGRDHSGSTTLRANSVLRNNSTFGVLKVTLHPTSYDWNFASEAGYTFQDSGTRSCH